MRNCFCLLLLEGARLVIDSWANSPRSDDAGETSITTSSKCAFPVNKNCEATYQPNSHSGNNFPYQLHRGDDTKCARFNHENKCETALFASHEIFAGLIWGLIGLSKVTLMQRTAGALTFKIWWVRTCQLEPIWNGWDLKIIAELQNWFTGQNYKSKAILIRLLLYWFMSKY